MNPPFRTSASACSTRWPLGGSMISMASPANGGQEILSYYPNLWIAPGVLIVLAVLAFNFVGDGLRDAFDPKMKR